MLVNAVHSLGLGDHRRRDRGQRRRQLVGTKTFGKGVVQTIFPLRDGSAVKITTRTLLTPDGHDINTIGIQPQILAEIPKGTKIRPGYPDEDPQLDAALSYLNTRLAQAGRSPRPGPEPCC